MIPSAVINRQFKKTEEPMKVKFTSRDFKFFILGSLAAFVFVIIYDWEEFEKGFKGGAPDNIAITEQLN